MDINSIEKMMKATERYISVLDMPFKGLLDQSSVQCKVPLRKGMVLLIVLLMLLVSGNALSPLSAFAEMVDRVIAFIDDEAITLTDLRDYYSVMHENVSDISEAEALETLINRKLILREANRLKLKGLSDDDIIEEFIDIKFRAFIKVSEKEIGDFYNQHNDRFSDLPLDRVRKDIEAVLIEEKVNMELKKYVKELRTESYIKVNLTPF
jgi:hypothetical protein